MLEAICKKCGETFVPHSEDPEDLIHEIHSGCDEDGEECGGQGEITREYILPSAPTQGPPPSFEDMEAQAAYDDFWHL